MANTIETTLSLFSGVGGLDIGWEVATGAITVGYAERDSYAAATILARMEGAAMEPAPIWCGDICELPTASFFGVDAIIGGFPCQDISVAGKGAGIDGARSGLWGRAFVPIIRELRPRYVFLENVGALVVRGLDTVLGDLAALGFDAEWASVRASAVGASHRRERVFILAHAERATGGQARRAGQPQRQAGRAAMGDTDCARLEGQRERGAAPIAGLSGGAIFSPGPSSPDWPAIIAERPGLAPAVESGVRMLGDGMAYLVDASRADQLRCVGNGVVPLQAAVAAQLLLSRFGDAAK